MRKHYLLLTETMAKRKGRMRVKYYTAANYPDGHNLYSLFLDCIYKVFIYEIINTKKIKNGYNKS